MGNICDCLNNDSDGEGLVPPVTRDSRYGGLRDPVPVTSSQEGTYVKRCVSVYLIILANFQIFSVFRSSAVILLV